MARLMFTCVLLMVGLVALGIAADLDGRWIGEMQGPEGSMEMAFTFKVSGDTLSGSVQNPMGDMPFTGKVDGDNFNFSIDFEGMSIDHRCVVSGDSIYMTVPGFEGQDMHMILLRDTETKE